MIFLFFSLAIAEPLSYTIKKGDPAPIDGRLFNDEAVVNLIASNEELQEQCQISLQYQGKTLAAQHALEMEYVKAELEIEKKKKDGERSKDGSTKYAITSTITIYGSSRSSKN